MPQNHEASAGAIISDETNRDADSWETDAPHTTLVMACYRVAQYLPEFLASLDAQAAEHRGYELIFVVDGCPEHSETVIREWAQSTDYAVRIVVKHNGGVGSARNVGFGLARGQWVTSPDPDDRLHGDYLAEIEQARAAHPDETMFVGRIRFLNPKRVESRHPLDYKFADETRRVVDLGVDPELIQTLGGVVFFDRSQLAAHELTVREDLPTASDADFIMQYLLATTARYVLVPGANYYYQRRADESSIVKTQEAKVDRYRAVFGATHRRLLEQAGEDCPRWLANTLLYFTHYLFRRNLRADSPVYTTDPIVLAEIAAELRENLRRIGAEHIDAFRIVDLPLEIRAAWLAAADRSGAGTEAESSPVLLLRAHTDGATVCFYSPRAADAADARVITGDVEIVERKSRSVEFLGEHFTYQHILRLSAGDLATVKIGGGGVRALDGRVLDEAGIRRALGLVKPAGAKLNRSTTPGAAAEGPGAGASDGSTGRASALLRGLRPVLGRARLSLALRAATVSGKGRTYADAWVFDGTDRDESFERLFRVVADARQRGVVAVVDGRDAVRRLRAAGYLAVARGKAEHFVVLKHAVLLLARGFEAVVPFSKDVLQRTWRTVHVPATPPGDRAYRDLNRARFDFVAVNSSDEEDLFAGDGDYRFLPSEVLRLDAYRDAVTQSSQYGQAYASVLAAAAG